MYSGLMQIFENDIFNLDPSSTSKMKGEREWDRCCDTFGIALTSHNYATADKKST